LFCPTLEMCSSRASGFCPVVTFKIVSASERPPRFDRGGSGGMWWGGGRPPWWCLTVHHDFTINEQCVPRIASAVRLSLAFHRTDHKLPAIRF
jgi:hypothetical protein